jgi:hypothetical protein
LVATCVTYSPRLHNAGPIIWFRGAEMHSLRGRLRTPHIFVETILAPPRYRAARSKGGDLASRQEGATAVKAVPFSELRLSIATQQSGERDDDLDLPVRDRGDDFFLPLCSSGRDERRGLNCDDVAANGRSQARNQMPRGISSSRRQLVDEICHSFSTRIRISSEIISIASTRRGSHAVAAGHQASWACHRRCVA